MEAAGPTSQHLMAFGAVIQWFARHEFLMQTAMAGITGMDLGPVAVLTAGLNYTAKRDALLSLIQATTVSEDKTQQIREYLDELHKYNALRNSIAHSLWVQGERANAIKPMRLVVRGGVVKLLGHAEGEQDFTAEELLQSASEIAGIYNRFLEFLIASKLIPESAVARNNAQTAKRGS